MSDYKLVNYNLSLDEAWLLFAREHIGSINSYICILFKNNEVYYSHIYCTVDDFDFKNQKFIKVCIDNGDKNV